MKKFKICMLVAIGVLTMGGCGEQQAESTKEEPEKSQLEQEKKEEEKSQLSVEEFCEEHGITIKEEGFSYVNLDADTGDLVTETTSTTEVEVEEETDSEMDVETLEEDGNVESPEETSEEGSDVEIEEEIALVDRKDVLSEEDWNIISMFIPDVNKASIHSEEESYESFDVIQLVDKRRILVNKQTLYGEKTNYYSGGVNFNTKITDTRMEKLDNDVDCLVMETEIGDIYKIFYMDDGRVMWQINETITAWEE